MAQSSAAPLRVVLVGAGFIATRGHLPPLQRHPDTEVVALVEVNAARAQAVAAEYAIPAYYTDFDAMLDKVHPDLVIICTPNAFHAPLSIAALNAGSHVLCEKPMALTVAEAETMVETAKRNDRVLTIGLHNRFRPEMDTLKTLIDEGHLGDTYYAKASTLRRRGIPGYGSWFTNRDLAGGGALMDIGVHMVDLAVWLLGNPKPVSVMGMTYQHFGPRRRGLGGWGVDAPAAGAVIPDTARYDVDDLASGIVRFENGATLVVDVSWAAYSAQEERLQVMGTEGGAEVYTMDRVAITQTPLKLYSDMGNRPAETYPLIPQYPVGEGAQWQQITTLVNAIRHGTPLRVTPEQVLDVTRILVGLQESASTGRSVEIN